MLACLRILRYGLSNRRRPDPCNVEVAADVRMTGDGKSKEKTFTCLIQTGETSSLDSRMQGTRALRPPP